jgi:hypothetical protein
MEENDLELSSGIILEVIAWKNAGKSRETSVRLVYFRA